MGAMLQVGPVAFVGDAGDQLTTCRLACLQVQDVINNATAKMTAAGAVLVPFDSQVLNDASAMAWGGGLESYDYEDTDTLARCVLQLHRATYHHCGWV